MAKGYEDRKRFTEKQLVARCSKLTPDKAQLLIRSLVDALYGAEADENWGADTLDSIAQLLYNHNLTP